MSPRKSVLRWLSLLVLVSFLLAACAPTAPATQPATEAPGAETEAPPAEKKVVTFIWTQEFDTLNPLYTNMWFVSVLYPVYMCQAWWFDDQNSPIPNLVTEIPSAENGGISADGRTITLKLRDDIVWSDGTPITSADFKFTYDMLLADGNAVASRSPYDIIESLETPDERTVVATFTEPYAPWLSSLFSGSSGISIVPAHVLQPAFEAEGTIDTAEWNTAPTVGCGPFVFDEWESGSFARFVANDNFWLGRPKLDELFFQFVPDDASMIAALVAGDGDVGTFFAYSDLPQLEEAGIKIMNSFSGYNEGWYLNLHPEKGNPALKDVRVRQALAYGFDRQTLVQDLLLDRTKVAATDWDNTPWVDPTITPYPFDPDKAKALLKEAGWEDTNGDGTVDKDGVELVLKYGTTTREVRQDTQAVAQQDLAAVGIGIDLQSFSTRICFSPATPMTARRLTSRWTSSSTPTRPTSLIPILRYGVALRYLRMKTRLASTPVVCAMRSWRRSSKSRNLRLTSMSANKHSTRSRVTSTDQAYWIGMWQDPDLFGFSDRMINVKMSGAIAFFNVAEWDVTE